MNAMQGDVLMGTGDHPPGGGGQPDTAAVEDNRTSTGTGPRPPWDRPEQRAALPALYDMLTLLPNDVLLVDRLSMALTRTHRTAEPIAVVRCSIGGIDRLRAEHGDEQADKVLTMIAKRLQRSVRTCDTVARTDGDQFILLLERLANALDIHVVLGRVRETMTDPIIVERDEHTLDVIMGAVITNDPMLEIDELLEEAARLHVVAKDNEDNVAAFSDWTMRIFGDAAAALDKKKNG